MGLKYIVVAIVAIAITAFALQNNTPTAVRFLFWNLPGVPLATIILVSVTLGVVLVGVPLLIGRWRLRLRLRSLEARVGTTETRDGERALRPRLERGRRALALGAGARVLLEVVAAAGAPNRGDRLHRPGRMHGGGVRDPTSARARERRRRASARPRGRRWVDAPLRLRAGDDHADAGRSAGRRIGVARAPAALTRGADLMRGLVVSPRWRRKRRGSARARGGPVDG